MWCGGGDVVDARSRSSAVQGTRRLVEAISAEPLVSATAIQTVRLKGYDGFAIALVGETVGRQMTSTTPTAP